MNPLIKEILHNLIMLVKAVAAFILLITCWAFILWTPRIGSASQPPRPFTKKDAVACIAALLIAALIAWGFWRLRR
jgi:hypothetical protein